MLTAERVLALLVSLWLLGCCGSGTLAATYHVGKGQRFATMQDLLSAVALVDHDVVLVHPGTYPPFVVERGGGSSPETAPVIRASDVTRRPVFDAAGANVESDGLFLRLGALLHQPQPLLGRADLIAGTRVAAMQPVEPLGGVDKAHLLGAQRLSERISYAGQSQPARRPGCG